MNGLDKITGRIAADARNQADRVLADAKAQAEAIAADAEAQSRRECAGIAERGEQAIRSRVERLASMAQLEGRKRILAAKQACIAEAFDQALNKMLALPQEEYVELLAQMAARVSVTGRESVMLSPKDRKKLGRQVVTRANELLTDRSASSAGTGDMGGTGSAGSTGSTVAGKLTLSKETRDIPGGFILASGGVEMNCAFDTLIRLAKPELERRVAQILFED